MAKSKKIDKDMGFRLKKARLDQKLTYDELSEKSDSSFVLYTSLPIHFFIQRL